MQPGLENADPEGRTLGLRSRWQTSVRDGEPGSRAGVGSGSRAWPQTCPNGGAFETPGGGLGRAAMGGSPQRKPGLQAQTREEFPRREVSGDFGCEGADEATEGEKLRREEKAYGAGSPDGPGEDSEPPAGLEGMGARGGGRHRGLWNQGRSGLGEGPWLAGRVHAHPRFSRCHRPHLPGSPQQPCE